MIFLVTAILPFLTKTIFEFFSINDLFAQITFIGHYEEVYKYNRFQKISIKTLTTIVCSNFKNKQKIGLGHLRIYT